jgi:hypothetical protein
MKSLAAMFEAAPHPCPLPASGASGCVLQCSVKKLRNVIRLTPPDHQNPHNEGMPLGLPRLRPNGGPV